MIVLVSIASTSRALYAVRSTAQVSHQTCPTTYYDSVDAALICRLTALKRLVKQEALTAALEELKHLSFRCALSKSEMQGVMRRTLSCMILI